MTTDTFAAVTLATTYHDAMTMVSVQSAFHLPSGVSPAMALGKYLDACDAVGVKMHNDHWLARAEAVVADLTAKRKNAFDDMLRRQA